MSSMSDYLESGVLTHLFRTATFSKPPQLAICLATGALSDSMTGNLTLGGVSLEVANAGAYNRQVLDASDANWLWIGTQVSGSGNVDNIPDITFPVATAAWGVITHVAITDSGTYNAGHLLFHGPLQIAKTVTQNDQFKFSAGNLDIYAG